MYMTRALNEYDILVDPMKNGIASKKLIYELTKSYLESNEKNYLKTLTKEEKEKYIKESMSSYIINHKDKLEKKFERRTFELTSVIKRTTELKILEGYILFKTYLSTLNNHLVNGSKVDTNWIFTTNKYYSLDKYYDEQNIHKVALIRTDTNGLFDKDTFVVDMSSKENIEKLKKFLCNKIDQELGEAFASLTKIDKGFAHAFKEELVRETDPRFMGYNFSAKSNEVCFYNYIKKEKIVTVLEALEMDLFKNSLLDFNKYLLLPQEEKIKWLNNFKYKLEKVIDMQNDPYLRFIYNELYIENKNIKIINDPNKEKVMNANTKILRLASSIRRWMNKN